LAKRKAILAAQPEAFGFEANTIQREGGPKIRAWGTNLHHGTILAAWTDIVAAWQPIGPPTINIEVLYLLIDHGSGPTVGIEGGQVYINDQPIENFSNVAVQERIGTMDQTAMTGFDKHKVEFSIQHLLREDEEPYIFTTPDKFFTDVEFTLEFTNGLIRYGNDGIAFSVAVHFHIDISEHGEDDWTYLLDADISDTSEQTLFKLYKASVQGFDCEVGKQYDIRFSRETEDDREGYHDNVVLRSIREVVDIGYQRPGRALIGLRAVGSSRLSGGIDVKVVRKDRVIATYDADGNETIQHSANRAWVTWDVLTMPAIKGNDAGSWAIDRFDGIHPSQLDFDFFYKWSLFSDVNIDDGFGGEEHRSDCNLRLENFVSSFSLALAIAQVGRVRLYWRGNVLTGWIDDVVTTPIDLVTMDSIMEKTWENEWAAQEELEAVVEVAFKDSRQGYEDVIVEYSDTDAGNYRKSIGVNGLGLNTRGAAIHFARYLIERNRLIRNRNKFRVHKEGFRYTLGDTIRLQCKPANWGHAFTVRSSTADTITVDRDASDDVNVGDYLYIRSYNTGSEKVITYAREVDSVVENVITVTVAWTVTPVKGSLVATGLETDFKLRRIISIKPTQKNYFDVVVETYTVELFDSDDYEPLPPDTTYQYPGPLPALTSPVTQDELNKKISAIVPWQPNINVPWPGNLTFTGSLGTTVTWTKTDGDNDITFRYAGTTHIIAEGATTLKYIYWDPASPNEFKKTNTLATAIGGGDHWMMCINEDGVVHSPNPQQVIHGGLIQAGTITAGFGQIGKLAVGSAELADFAATPEKLAASNFTNLIANPGFEAGDIVWTKPTDGIIYETGYHRNGAWAARVGGTGNKYFRSNKFYVVPGEKYSYSGWLYYDADYVAAGTTGTGISWYTADDVYISSHTANVTPDASWQKAAGVATVPATAAYGVFLFRYNLSDGSGYGRADDASVIRQAQTDDIEEGAVTEASGILADNAVVQAKLADLAVGTAKLANLAVSEGKIAALAVTSAKIGLLAVETAHIKDLNVSTLKIANNAVSLMVAAFTAGSLTFDDDYSWHEAQTITLTTTGAPVMLIAAVQWKNIGDNGCNIRVQRDDSTTVYSTNMFSAAQLGNPFCVALLDEPSAGEHTYDLDLATTNVSVGDEYLYFKNRSLVAKEVKK